MTTVKPHFHYVERGNKKGPTIVFLHGWPDTDRIFAKQYEAMEKTYRLVSFQLPFYAKLDSHKWPRYSGFSFDELSEMFATGVQLAMCDQASVSESLRAKPVLICHDWGAVISYHTLSKYPDLFSKVVALDIGQHVGHLGVKAKLMVVWYQWTLIWAFLLPSFIGTFLTRMVATLFKAPADRSLIHGRMGYLYVRMWMGLLSGSLPPSLKFFQPPKIPILYMYGAKKPFFFHSKKWIEHVQKQPGSAVMPFASDHWFFARSSCAADVNREILKFIAAE